VSTTPGLNARRMIPSPLSSAEYLATTMLVAALVELYSTENAMFAFCASSKSARPVDMTVIFLAVPLTDEFRRRDERRVRTEVGAVNNQMIE
jgi:hypothetical protein